MQRRGFFVTFEGGEGSGKSTQLKLFEERLQRKKISVLATREPGGTPLGLAIRRILFSARTPSPAAEVLLFSADRAQHVQEVILPHLEQGYVVLSDRYVDSTLAYQWGGRKIDRDLLALLHRFAAQELLPDLTFLLDIPPEIGLARKGREKNRFDQLPLSFHKRVRRTYRKLAQEAPERIASFNGTLPQHLLFEKMWALFETRYKKSVHAA